MNVLAVVRISGNGRSRNWARIVLIDRHDAPGWGGIASRSAKN